MNILFTVNALTIGGAQNLLLNLSKTAVKQHHNVYIAAFRGGELQSEFENCGAKVYILGEFLFDILGFLRLFKLIRAIKPDIIHSHLFRASFWSRMACVFNLRIPLVTTLHGVETAAYTSLERRTWFLSDKTVFSSQFLRKWYRDNIVENRNDFYSKVIYPWNVSNSLCSAKPINRNKKHVVIGALSRLHRLKGLDTLIEAFAALSLRCSEARLLIGGDGAELNRLRALTEELHISDKCNFLGRIKDKEEFFSSIDIFASPSQAEGFGISICEAMEHGIPVVASKVGGIPEIIKDGKNGRLIAPGSSNELTDVLEELCCFPEERRRLGCAGLSSVQTLFPENEVAEKYFSLYKELLKNKKRGIHFVVSSGELGGGERLALGLMKHLGERCYNISLTCAGDPLKSAAESLGIKTSVCSMHHEGVPFFIRLVKDLIRLRPAYVSSHLNKAGLFAGILGRILHTKTLAHVHGLNRLSYYKYSNVVIAVSDAVKKHICKQGLSDDEVVLINNCIDKPALKPRKLINNSISVGITAKLHENKGHKWALEAIADHINELNISKVHIIGDGPEKERLSQLCNNEPLKSLVVFHGFVNDVDALYPNIDVLLLPSAGEGIPLSLLEGMRFGIPCVATDRGGIPEIVTNGKNGILVPYGDREALIKAFQHISKPDEYEKFSKESVTAFKNLNDYENMLNEFEALL